MTPPALQQQEEAVSGLDDLSPIYTQFTRKEWNKYFQEEGN